MKAILLVAAFTSCMVGSFAVAEERSLEYVLRAPQLEQSRTILVAEAPRPRPTCKDDERDLPRGSTICRNGRVMVCSPQGTWQDRGRAC